MKTLSSDIHWYKDWQLWLLLIAINISGNPGFNVLFPYHATIIALFIGLLAYLLIKQKRLPKKEFIYILLWTFLFIINGIYVKEFAINSTLHIIMKMAIGIFILLILNKKFSIYYSNIIYFFCILSLLCFIYNHTFGVLPYINLGESMDGGKGFRVTSIIYTQLYNLNSHGLVFRNCGPFWEPGAFQGFINLAITIELLSNKERSRSWYLKILIFIITIITTFSTGGYIALALNLVYYIFSDMRLSKNIKIISLISFLILAFILFFNVDFLYDKISSNDDRLGVTSSDLFSDNIMYTLFGYGFAEESIMQSDINSASSIFNLFRYTGLFGVLLYFIPFISSRLSINQLFYATMIFLIMMNEPFITAGVFWWSMPLLFPYINNTDLSYEYSVSA